MGRSDFPLFFTHFSFLTHFFVVFFFFFVFLRFPLLLLKDKGKQQQNLLQKGEFHSDPVCADPVQNFPIDAPLGAAKETPKRVPKQTGAKMPSFRVAQEPNWNRKPEPSEPFCPKPKAEPEPPEPFSRNRFPGTGTVLSC